MLKSIYPGPIEASLVTGTLRMFAGGQSSGWHTWMVAKILTCTCPRPLEASLSAGTLMRVAKILTLIL